MCVRAFGSVCSESVNEWVSESVEGGCVCVCE